MTKLTITRIFDVGELTGSKAATEINPFISYVNQVIENFTRIMNKGIGIRDNCDSDIKTLSLAHNVPITFTSAKKPILIIPGRQIPTTNKMIGFVWGFKTDTEITVEASFANNPTEKTDVTLLITYS
jgi:hypothetical protein